MTLQIPTLKQCVNNVLYTLQTAFKPNDDATAQQTPTAAKLRRDNDYIQGFAFGSALYGVWQYIRDYVALQSCPLTATGIFLVWWGMVYAVYQKLATAAFGTVTITALHGTVIPVNTVLRRGSDGWEYKTDAEITVESVGGAGTNGTATLNVTSSKAGSGGNAGAGIVLSLSVPIAGVVSTIVASIDRGTEDELEEDFRSRILFRIQNPPHGGAPSDYEMWALEVAGVSKAWCERVPDGPGSVGLRFMMTTGFPSPADKTAVETYIADRTRGPGADDVIVTIPTAVPVDITVTGFTPDDAATRAAAKLQLQDLFYRYQYPEAVLPLSHIREALSTTPNEYDHTLTLPASNPTATINQILTLGTVTINGVVV